MSHFNEILYQYLHSSDQHFSNFLTKDHMVINFQTCNSKPHGQKGLQKMFNKIC